MGDKKLWSFGRAVLYMFRKGLTKSKLTRNLNQMLRRSNTRVNRFEYEFSCSNSPDYPLFSKIKSSCGRRRHNTKDADHEVVQKVLDMLNEYDVRSLSPTVELPGFGHSPAAVRQLRVTDSPFQAEELEENPQVNKDAEDFINQFYTHLKQER